MRPSTSTDGVALALGATAIIAITSGLRHRGSHARIEGQGHLRRLKRIVDDPRRADRVDAIMRTARRMRKASWCEAEDALWGMSDAELEDFEAQVIALTHA